MNRSHRSHRQSRDIIGDRWHGAATSVVFRVDVPAEPSSTSRRLTVWSPPARSRLLKRDQVTPSATRHLCPRIFGNPFEGQIIGAVVDRPAGVGPAIDDVVLAGVQISHFERLVGARDASGGDVSFDDGILQEVDVDIDANRITNLPTEGAGCSVVKR